MDCNNFQEKIWEEGLRLQHDIIMNICSAINNNKNMIFTGDQGLGQKSISKILEKISNKEFVEINFRPTTREDTENALKAKYGEDYIKEINSKLNKII